MYERDLDINNVFELRTKTTDYFGCGAINKIFDIAKTLKSEKIQNVLVVTSNDNVHLKCGAWETVRKALTDNDIEFKIFNEVMPNPTDEATDKATKIGLEMNAQAIIGIGGGSSIDLAKSAAIMIEYPDYTTEDLYKFNFTPEKALPIIAINTTHGTGTEVNRFAVVTITKDEYKPAIAYDCIYPTFSIDDPDLMLSLPMKQTIYTVIDAVNHVIEAATTTVASPYSIMMAKETIQIANKYLPKVIENPKDREARYYLTFASAIAGISFDNGLLHFTHALEHPLSAVKPDLTHGLGLAMILPAVIEKIYPAKSNTLAEILSPITNELSGNPEEAKKAAIIIEKWLAKMGVPEKLEDLGFTEKDIDKLVELTQETPSLSGLLAISPVKAGKDVIRSIFSESLKAHN